MRRLILVGLLVFAVALSGTAYAEVQNIKVSGDIDMKAMTHRNYDLKSKLGNETAGIGGVGGGGVTSDDDVNFVVSTTHVKVDADLTDNVSTSVRLLNQRIWDAYAAGQDDIHIDNAYVVLKEFLYSPLTVIVGRQDLKYGNGFIVGSGNLGDPEGAFGALDAVHAGGTGQEFSAFNAYDALRLILDFAPLTVEGVWAKINETGSTDDDADLYGVVVNYKLDRWNAEVEPYWFYKKDEDGVATTTVNDAIQTVVGGDAVRSYERNYVHTVGLRGAGSPVDNLHLSAEGAYQFGEMADTTAAGQVRERNRNGWGAEIDARYNWVTVPWTPTTGIGWVYYSGESATTEQGRTGATGLAPGDSNDTFNAWDPMFRGQFHTFIQDFLSGRDAPAGIYTTFDVNDTAATTNRQLLYGDVSLKPIDDVTLWARYTHAWFAKAPRVGRSHDAGDEVDVKLLYDYTEDVQLGLFGGWFFPGHYYDQPGPNNRGNDVAWLTGGSASVKF